MALQNRVAPDGTIFADPARGTFMGNRGGKMHDGAKRLTTRRWVSKQWIACALSYKDHHETMMAPGRYTQLFFLDEATALAAGHRPCALCRRPDFLRFTEHWRQLRGLASRPLVADIDPRLHAERIDHSREKKIFTARLGDLPDGAMLTLDDDGIWLLHRKSLRQWSASGYGATINTAPARQVRVLTPPSIVAVIAAGYAPMLHDSARSMSAAKST